MMNLNKLVNQQRLKRMSMINFSKNFKNILLWISSTAFDENGIGSTVLYEFHPSPHLDRCYYWGHKLTHLKERAFGFQIFLRRLHQFTQILPASGIVSTPINKKSNELSDCYQTSHLLIFPVIIHHFLLNFWK